MSSVLVTRESAKSFESGPDILLREAANGIEQAQHYFLDKLLMMLNSPSNAVERSCQ